MAVQKFKPAQFLHLENNHIQCRLQLFRFREEEYYVNYIPALQLVAFGADAEQSRRKIYLLLRRYIRHLKKLPNAEQASEIRALDWMRDPIREDAYLQDHKNRKQVLKDFAGIQLAEKEIEDTDIQY